jgi:hypothetical protein
VKVRLERVTCVDCSGKEEVEIEKVGLFLYAKSGAIYTLFSAPVRSVDGLVWYLKQLLPLKYATVYGYEGKWHFVQWRMWFGRCFATHDEELPDLATFDPAVAAS